MIWQMTSVLVKRTTRRYLGALLILMLDTQESARQRRTHYLFFAWVTNRLRA